MFKSILFYNFNSKIDVKIKIKTKNQRWVVGV
jgi:hypothetical protein